ncbi:acyltransferase [Cryomorpha ignava]|uniref:Acyltransferase n=1 Tax=Cryomorpha ignava TaxID=101383 RepID=A0A7K3WLM6_9FLAO|nr:acyltransferase [Cryomorpha ignava]NEN22556.1 acyltransferase [Cryomorpha ignava]
MFSKIYRRIKIELARRVGPVMVNGYKNPNGEIVKHTRYGSTTYFQGVENTKIGDHVYIAQHCFIDGSRGLKIDEGCQICSFVSILTHSSHLSIRLYGSEYKGSDMKGYVVGATEIGAYTFVGPYVTIMPGSTIGKGSIISAYAYVKGTFQDYAIIAGNPAKVVGDTRELDAPYLEKHPELLTYYNNWSHG